MLAGLGPDGVESLRSLLADATSEVEGDRRLILAALDWFSHSLLAPDEAGGAEAAPASLRIAGALRDLGSMIVADPAGSEDASDR